MKKFLVILRGLPGAGKSTLIKKMGWTDYVLSADTLRLMFNGPIEAEDGSLTIDQGMSSKAWQTLYAMLDSRMVNGAFTVLDNTHLNHYEALRERAEKHSYRVVCVDFVGDDVDAAVATALAHNEQRRGTYRYVPPEVILRMAKGIEPIPSTFEVVRPDDL